MRYNFSEIYGRTLNAPKPEKKEIAELPPKTARKVKDVERLLYGSIIGKEVLKCSHCHTKISFTDLFCKHCGFEFLEDEDG